METVKATSDAVVCTLSASEIRERLDELRPRMLDLITTVQETDDGYTIGFAPGSIDTVREFVAFESKCCGFMTYTIDDSSGRVIWLGLSGPEGTKEFVRGWLSGRILEGIDGHAR